MEAVKVDRKQVRRLVREHEEELFAYKNAGGNAYHKILNQHGRLEEEISRFPLKYRVEFYTAYNEELNALKGIGRKARTGFNKVKLAWGTFITLIISYVLYRTKL